MNALSKAKISEALCTELELNKFDAKEIVEQFFEYLRIALESGQSVRLSGFGNFNLRDKAQRPGRNPKTGKIVPVAARRVVTFKPGLKLKKKLQDKVDEDRAR